MSKFSAGRVSGSPMSVKSMDKRRKAERAGEADLCPPEPGNYHGRKQ